MSVAQLPLADSCQSPCLMFLAYLIAVVALVICVVFSLILGAALAYVYTKLKALGKSTTHTKMRLSWGHSCCLHVF